MPTAALPKFCGIEEQQTHDQTIAFPSTAALSFDHSRRRHRTPPHLAHSNSLETRAWLDLTTWPTRPCTIHHVSRSSRTRLFTSPECIISTARPHIDTIHKAASTDSSASAEARFLLYSRPRRSYASSFKISSRHTSRHTSRGL